MPCYIVNHSIIFFLHRLMTTVLPLKQSQGLGSNCAAGNEQLNLGELLQFIIEASNVPNS
jgi:hypothetical protein